MALIEDIWYGRAPIWAKPLAWTLRAGSVPYRWGLTRSQRAKLARRQRLPRPVFSVGNLTVGGVGKTPVVQHLARAAVARGIRPAILSRGYGARLPGPVQVDLAKREWSDFGDEPTLLAQSLREVPVYIGADRFRSGVRAVEQFPEIELFLLDDGFQHLELHRDFDLVLVDAQSGFGNGWTLPAGPLREPAAALERAHATVVVSKIPGAVACFDPPFGPRPLFLELAPVRLVPIGSSEPLTIEEIAALRPVRLLSGIGSPEGFARTAESMGLRVVSHAVYRDHHAFTESEVIGEIHAARSAHSHIVTTAKDAVRLAPFSSHWTTEDCPLIIELGLNSGDAVQHLEKMLEVVARSPVKG